MKKLLVCMTVISGLFITLGVIVHAADLDISHVTYRNDAGAITALTEGETVHAELSVKNKGYNDQKLVFSAQLFNEGDWTDFDFEQYVMSAGEEKKFTTTLLMPDDISKCSIEVTLWEDLSNMQPLCNLGTFPSGNISTNGVSVNGVSIKLNENGENEAPVVISTNKSYPLVEVKAIDNSTNVEVVNPVFFPGRSSVKITAANGDKAEYTISYKSEKPLVENLVYTGPEYASDGVPYTDNSVILSAFKLRTQNENGTPLTQGYDNQVTRLDLPAGYELQGVPYISPSWNYYDDTSANLKKYPNVISAWVNADTMPWYKVSLNYSADICILSRIGLSNFVKQSDWTTLPRKGNGRSDSTTAYAWVNNKDKLPWICMDYFSVKRVDVGDTPQTVTFYNGNRGGMPYIVFFMAKYYVE